METTKATRHRGHGEGTITERPGGRFQAQVLVNGKRLSYTADTKREAQRWIRETMTKADQGMLGDAGKVTVGAFLDKWLAAVSPSIKPKTIQSYEGTIRRHLVPMLGALKLSALRADHLQQLYAAKLESGLSKRSVQLCHAVIRHALDDALKWNLVPRNVADAVTAPRPDRHEMCVWSADQVRAFLDGVTGTRHEALYRLALTTATRSGEMLGLTWDDVDLDAGRLQVRRTVQRLGKGKGIVVGEPKTGKARRRIDLPGAVVEALRRWKVRQLEERLFAGPRWKDSGYIFTTTVGTGMEERALQDDFHAHTKRLGLPRIRVHDMRHTAATTLLSQNVHPKIVQELLGHSTIAMTMDTYSHVLPTMQGEATRTMERLFG